MLLNNKIFLSITHNPKIVHKQGKRIKTRKFKTL
uniref:Uncharacterized protein n=1 Tax=Rhizophora mucronata TaxID=61149 RepID=A0A2P2Q042_RHIMU